MGTRAEKFLEQVWKWKHQYGGRSLQLLRLVPPATSRERFTMDEVAQGGARGLSASMSAGLSTGATISLVVSPLSYRHLGH